MAFDLERLLNKNTNQIKDKLSARGFDQTQGSILHVGLVVLMRRQGFDSSRRARGFDQTQGSILHVGLVVSIRRPGFDSSRRARGFDETPRIRFFTITSSGSTRAPSHLAPPEHHLIWLHLSTISSGSTRASSHLAPPEHHLIWLHLSTISSGST
ncbi:hypothetical protein RRG08_047747 [Elysia crispata]|uniref:Uncharacterized protein n=1 Tax=Elysia crispata TaxID=231223 RepID=A0AAE1A5V0_9GAST|nr:hypothetical protein RRG08_047747 [Elysia crispata]